MKRLIKRIGFCFCIASVIWCVTVIRDKYILKNELIRMHIVANSDSSEDQALKIRVRDRICAQLEKDLADISNVEEAEEYLRENIPKLQKLANRVLADAGFSDSAVVSLGREAFNKRVYETFTLPAGIYRTLRVVIGNGEGKNWWCVAFPSLCVPTEKETFSAVALETGFSDALTNSVAGTPGYEIRFLCLELLGKLENSLWGS